MLITDKLYNFFNRLIKNSSGWGTCSPSESERWRMLLYIRLRCETIWLNVTINIFPAFILLFSSIMVTGLCWFHRSGAVKHLLDGFGLQTPTAVDLPRGSSGSDAAGSLLASEDNEFDPGPLLACALLCPCSHSCRRVRDWLFYLWAYRRHWCQSDW